MEKFQKLLMTGCRYMDKNHKKCHQNGGFPPFVNPQDFSSKIGFCHFCNKTSIQWTPGSQIYRSNQETIFGKNDFWKKQ